MILLLFFLSGAAGLLYEVLWSKYLALSLGGTALAQTAVLALYLGGLGLGYAFFGRRADRSEDPLGLYGRLELALALLGALTTALPAALETHPRLLAVLMVLPPAFLMGGTLPALARRASTRLEEVQSSLAGLYSVNAAGAALGALTADFLLVPALGLDLSTLSAAGLNLLCGLSALTLARRRRAPAHEPEGALRAPPAHEPPGPLQARTALAAAFLAGAASLALEVAWTRLFAQALGASVYAFALMLASFILGISVGGAWLARGPLPRVPPFLLLGLCLLGSGTAALAVLPLYGALPLLFMKAARLIGRTPETFLLHQGLQLVLCAALTLPATVFLGMALPLAARTAVRRTEETGSGIGLAFGLNTAGNVLGAAAAGLWLLPALGVKGLVELAAGVQLGLGSLAVLLFGRWSAARRACVCAACLAAAAAFCASSTWDKALLASGTYRYSGPAPSWEEFKQGVLAYKTLYYKDDAEGTVTVIEDPGGVRYLKVNGKTDASSGDDLATQELLAHLPMLLRPRASDVLLIGLGSGVSAGAALAHPLRRLDAVEISPAVAEASDLFTRWSGGPLSDERLSLHLEDAKTFMARAERRYDVILSEPSNPWMAGVARLFSADFYRRARGRLAPGGLFAQWFHTYEMTDSDFLLVVRTFASSFPHATLWSLYPGRDVLLLGSEAPLGTEGLEEAFRRPEALRRLAAVGVGRPTTLLALQTATDPAVRRMAGRGRLHEDRFPLLDYSAPRALFLDRRTFVPEAYDGRFADPASLLALWLAGRGRGLSKDELAGLAAYDRRYGTRLAERARAGGAR